MSANTTRLSLTKPGGGSTGLITPPDPVDIDVINANMDKIDASIGAPSFTSVTRPASPFDGQTIYETDTGLIAIYRQTGAAWVYPNATQNVADLNAMPAVAIEGRTVHVDELNVNFQAQDGVWVQIGTARFADTTARDNAYAKAAGVYKVDGALVARADVKYTEIYLASAGLTSVSGWYTQGLTTTRRHQAGALTLTNATPTVPFDTASVTPTVPHFTYAAGVLTCVRAGLYEIDAKITVGGVATGWIIAILVAAATVERSINFATASGSTNARASTKRALAVGDTITVTGFSTTNNAISTGSDLTSLEVNYLGPA